MKPKTPQIVVKANIYVAVAETWTIPLFLTLFWFWSWFPWSNGRCTECNVLDWFLFCSFLFFLFLISFAFLYRFGQRRLKKGKAKLEVNNHGKIFVAGEA
ncbi:hypothetical protein VNO80_19262 [Phaseolus coccineus]|uniref:Uncharacterized protein n=1 Tax=Phaseolus coccineus TaxID=3886 RepID=A0AAN9QX58_PHACN